ncbi:hypothetical protein [Streptomyces pactum]|uniref:hypothetical protein n=1 Tax=Streptomyces pactum TaxID=68249 RepID=UPI0036F872B6
MEARRTAQVVLRALRAAVFAAVCVLPAALGHAVMSGSAVPWWTVAAGFAVTGGGAWALAGRERGPLAVIAVTVGAQVLLHNAFSLAQRAVAPGPAPGPAARPATGGHGTICGALPPAAHPAGGHHHAGALGGGETGPMTAEAGLRLPGVEGMHHGHGGLGMWSVHVVVALLCGIWLSGGEQAVHRLGRTLAVRLLAPLTGLFGGPTVTATVHRVRLARHRAGQRMRRLLLVHSIVTRGPPRPAAVR